MACCHLRWSDRVGANYGKGCTILMLVFIVVYILASLAYTLTTRLYLHGFYNSAHMAGLSVFIGVFVFAHHLCKINKALGCKIKAFSGVQIVMNLWIFLGCLAAAISYSLLAATTLTVNFDYIAAIVFAWIDVLLMFYLTMLSLSTCCSSWHFIYEVRSDKDINMYKLDKGSSHQNGAVASSNSISNHSSKNGCITCCNVLFGFLYLIFHLLFALIVVLSAYHPASTFYNIFKFHDSKDMYVVQVEGHKSLALYMKCRGSGDDTIVYENGLGGLALMQWDFIPKHLENQYRVCVHDRRGYGWSEGMEYDYINIDRQQAGNNVLFFRELVDKAKIKKPFYYIGHSYGGIHMTYAAHLYPEMIKGMVYLDTASFAVADAIDSLLEVISNFRALGLLNIAVDTGILDYKVALNEILDFTKISDDTVNQLLVSMMSGYYFESYMREKTVLYETAEYNGTTYFYPASELRKVLGSDKITLPFMVIDADNIRSFGKDLFLKYEENFHVAVKGATHESLVYGTPYSGIVSGLIDNFIKYNNGKITRNDLIKYINDTQGVVLNNITNGEDLN